MYMSTFVLHADETKKQNKNWKDKEKQRLIFFVSNMCIEIFYLFTVILFGSWDEVRNFGAFIIYLMSLAQ